MDSKAINLKDKLAKINEHWSPKVIAELNDYQFKLVKLQGEFVWRKHTDTDEAFLVLKGQLKISLKEMAVENETTIEINEGELYIVPRNIEHKPYAEQECEVMLIEPRGVVNTGDGDSELRADNDVWI